MNSLFRALRHRPFTLLWGGQNTSLNVMYNWSMARKTCLQKYMDTLREQLPTLAEQYHVATLEVFGSYVHHEERKDST